MRKLLTFLSVCVSLNAYDISLEREFELTMKPNILTALVGANISKTKVLDVEKHIKKYADVFSDAKNVRYVYGKTEINPEYKYINNESKFIGYKGHIGYQVESNSSQSINELILSIEKIQDKKTNDEKIKISNMNWKIDDETYKNKLSILRLQAIKWGKNYAKELSDELKDTCKIENIDLVNTPQSLPKLYVADRSAEPSIKQDENIKLTAIYKIRCR